MAELLTDLEKDLAKKLARLSGSLIKMVPGDEAKKKEILELMAEEAKTIAEAATAPSERPLKDVSDSLTDSLHAIHAVLPEYAEASKQRAKARFKSSVSIIEGILNMIGL